jgi:type IV pilus assembly protein PilO
MALMPKGQREQTLIFVCFLAVVAIVGYWHFLFVPKAAEIKTQLEHVANLEAVNQRAKAELARGSLSDLRAELAKYERTLSLVRTLVPASNEVPALLEQVSTAARREGLDLASVDPQPVVEADGYAIYQYGVAVLGGYNALGSFLSNVGSLTRIVLPVGVSLQLSRQSAAATKSRRKPESAAIEARFQLQTFVVRKTSDGDTPQTRPVAGAN